MDKVAIKAELGDLLGKQLNTFGVLAEDNGLVDI